MKTYYVYILTNKKRGTLYIGVTSNLKRRIWKHKSKAIKGFTLKYNLKKLVYFEETTNINIALQREKNLKKWNRQWKIDLIEKTNSLGKDLSEIP